MHQSGLLLVLLYRVSSIQNGNISTKIIIINISEHVVIKDKNMGQYWILVLKWGTFGHLGQSNMNRGTDP